MIAFWSWAYFVVFNKNSFKLLLIKLTTYSSAAVSTARMSSLVIKSIFLQSKFASWCDLNLIQNYFLKICLLALSLNHQSGNLTNIRAFLCDILPINQYLQQVFCPNIVPSVGTGSHFWGSQYPLMELFTLSY